MPQNVKAQATECFDATSRFVWEACAPLCQHICEHPQLVAGKFVVELGAGPAMPSHVAAALGARQVVATDGDEGAVAVIRNYLVEQADQPWTERIAAATVRWGNEQHADAVLEQNQAKPADVVLCSDLLYGHDAETSANLLATIRRLLGDGDGVCLISYQFRDNMLGELDFFERVGDAFESEGSSLRGGDDEDDDLWLFTLKRKRP